MSELFEFMTSEEMMIVGVVIFTAAILALIVFLIEKNYNKRKLKNNTKWIHKIEEDEQNKIVEEQKEVIPISNQVEVVSESTIGMNNNNQEVELLNLTSQEKPLVIPIEQFHLENALHVDHPKDLEKSSDEDVDSVAFNNPTNNSIESIYNEVKEEVEQLQYADPEPNKEEAKEELKKATEELIKQEKKDQIDNNDLTKFEEEQEENAIISLDELMQKSEVLYEQNEVTQYQDEGNEPISLEDLEQRMKNIQSEMEQLDQVEPIEDEGILIEEKPTVKLDDLNTIDHSSKIYREDIAFKSSPIISPIFGIEENKADNNLELENTANYDKLDEEIKKTNQFLATLRELQEKLE